MKKRFLAIFLALCVAAGMLVSSASAVIMPSSYGVNLDSSPYNSETNPFYASDLWGQCTWYCWGRALEKCGVYLPCRGNAGAWYNEAANSGQSDISVGQTPRANSIVVFSGHVAFIERLEGSIAYTSESNITLNQGKPNEIHYEYYEGIFNISNSTRWENYHVDVIGYIYLNPSDPEPEKPVSDNDFDVQDGELVKYKGKGGNVTIPDSITSIGFYAFDSCAGLTSVTIPASVTSIGSMAFFDCESLTSVTIPDGVTSIGSQTFSYSTSLTSVTIPSSVTGIEGNAFLGSTGLKDVYYGGSEAQWAAIKSGEAYSFRDDLTNATIHYNSTGPETPSTLPTVEDIPATGTAVAQTQNVLLDGKTVQFQNYAVKDANGNMTNYVRSAIWPRR